MGEIFVIAVDPAFHGRGLGRAMTVAGLQSLHQRGIELGMLYVDAANVAAVSLYYDLGFTLHHVQRAFVLDPLPEPSGPEQHADAIGDARRDGRDRHLPRGREEDRSAGEPSEEAPDDRGGDGGKDDRGDLRVRP